MNYWTLNPDHIYVAAHRGDSANFPENTMASFRSACEMGVDQADILRILREKGKH